MTEARVKDALCGISSPDSFPLFFFSETTSTNTVAKEYAESADTPFALFVAARQTAGRGRRGRSFLSEEGGLYCSFLLRPEGKADDLLTLTTRAAVNAARAIAAVAPDLDPKIKWVNDLYLSDKKIAGILTEGCFSEDGGLRFAVVGIGINVFPVAFPPALSAIAGSLSDFTEDPPAREALLAALAREFLEKRDTGAIVAEYRARSFLPGKAVTVLRPDRSYPAHVLGISDRCGLLVRLEGGETEELLSGEVSIRPQAGRQSFVSH